MVSTHSLSLPTGAVTPALLDKLKSRRSHGRCAGPREVRIKHGDGTMHFALASTAGALPEGVSVYVWWSGSEFVCAPVREVDARNLRHASVGDQVVRAREALAQARRDRPARLAAELAHTVDVNVG